MCGIPWDTVRECNERLLCSLVTSKMLASSWLMFSSSMSLLASQSSKSTGLREVVSSHTLWDRSRGQFEKSAAVA